MGKIKKKKYSSAFLIYFVILMYSLIIIAKECLYTEYRRSLRISESESCYLAVTRSPPPIHHLTEHHRRRHDPGPHDRSGIGAPILAPVRDHTHRDQLKRGNIYNKEGFNKSHNVFSPLRTFDTLLYSCNAFSKICISEKYF